MFKASRLLPGMPDDGTLVGVNDGGSIQPIALPATSNEGIPAWYESPAACAQAIPERPEPLCQAVLMPWDMMHCGFTLKP